MIRVLAAALLICAIPVYAKHYDVLLKSGTIYDGTGVDGISADIGIP